MAKFCGNCGAQAEDNEKFCGSCGAKFDDPISAPSPEPNPTDSGFVQADAASGGWSEPVQQNNDFQQAGEFQPAGGDVNGTYNGSAAFNNGGATPSAKSGKNNMPIIIAALAIIVVIVLVIVLVANRSTKIDAQDLFKIDFTGPNGYGTCEAVINIDPEVAYEEYGVYDYEDLVYDDDEKFSDYFSNKGSALKEAYGTDDKGEAEDMRDALLDYSKKKGEFGLSCDVSDESGLKNGDTVTITVNYDEDALDEVGIKLKNTSFEVEVKGLEEAETVEPFKDFAPTFEGYDGNGEMDYNYQSTAYNFVTFSLSDGSSYYLTNGDTVTFEAYISAYDYTYLDEDDSSKGFWFEYDDKVYVWPYDGGSATQEFTVEGLKELTEVDPFEGMTFEYSGASPFLSIDSVNLSDDFEYEDEISCYLDIDYGERFKVGDTFTVQVYAYSSLQEEGVKITGSPDDDGYYTKEFTVGEDVPTYVDSTNAAEAEAALDDKISGSVTQVKQDLQGSSYVSNVDLDDSIDKVKSMEKVDSYILFNEATSYDEIAGWWSTEAVNELIIIYKINATLEDGSQTFYAVFRLDDIYVSDGEYLTDNDISISYYEKEADATEVATEAEGYTATKIGEAAASTSSTADSSSASTTSSAASTTSSAASSSSTADSSTASASTSSTTSSTSTSSDTTSSEMVP